jgi:hypothetical protein
VTICRKSLKIPKGYSSSVNRRRTSTAMAKRERTNNDLQNATHIAKDLVTWTPLKPWGELRCWSFFSRPWFITGFVRQVTRQAPRVEQGLPTFRLCFLWGSSCLILNFLGCVLLIILCNFVPCFLWVYFGFERSW